MKTKTLLLLCLFLAIGLTHLNAQNTKNNTGSFTEYYTGSWLIPVYCNGEIVDNLQATMNVHHIGHFLKGDWLWCKVECTGEAVSELTKEVFSIKEIDKQENNIQPDGTWLLVDVYHFNMRGSNGTHYIGTQIIDWTGTITSVSAVCPGSNK
jgi:hypothetical protein